MLRDVFDAMDPLLKAAIGASLTHEFGAQNETKQSSAPRIVWVPTEDRYGAAKQANRDGAGNSATSPRHLFSVEAGVRIRFWGKPDYADAWALVQIFIQQLFQVPIYGTHAFRLERGGWDPANSALDVLGRSYHLWCSFGVPIVEATPTTKVITDAPQTNLVAFPTPPPAGHTEAV